MINRSDFSLTFFSSQPKSSSAFNIHHSPKLNFPHPPQSSKEHFHWDALFRSHILSYS
jgi:hypothetical protein